MLSVSCKFLARCRVFPPFPEDVHSIRAVALSSTAAESNALNLVHVANSWLLVICLTATPQHARTQHDLGSFCRCEEPAARLRCLKALAEPYDRRWSSGISEGCQ